MKNLYCRQLLTENYHLLPIEQIKQSWNKTCANKETLSGYPVYLFKNLEKLDNNFCVRPDEMSFLKKKNPYTNKRFIWSPEYKRTFPITEEYNDRLCPLQQLDSYDKYSFIASSSPIIDIQTLPEIIPVRKDLSSTFTDNSGKKVFVVSTINPSRIYSLHYYMIKLKEPILTYQSSVKRTDIVRMRTLYKKQKAQILFTPFCILNGNFFRQK